MKSLRDEIKRIWRESFNDSREYVDMYFDRVYREADAMVYRQDGSAVSSLLLQSYAFRFQGEETAMGYIAGAATRRSSRGQGYMSRLMILALEAARERGDMLCALIPAHDWLYNYYDRFGFTTVFFSDRQRYTSLHKFACDGVYVPETDNYSDRVFEAFRRFEAERGCGVIHSRRDFLNTLDDLSFEPGGVFAAMNDSSGELVSMAWASKDSDLVIVKELLGRDEDARRGALAYLRSRFPDKPFMVIAPPVEGLRRHLYSKAMGRLVNVGKCLEIVAHANPRLKLTIKVSDHILAANSGLYRIACGECIREEIAGEKGYPVSDGSESDRGRLPDFNVPVETLTDIVFSSPQTGAILGFPSERPHISLMLD